MEAWLHDMRVLKEQEEAATQDAALKSKMWGEVRAPAVPHFTPQRAGVSSVLAQEAVRRSRARGRGERERERKGGSAVRVLLNRLQL